MTRRRGVHRRSLAGRGRWAVLLLAGLTAPLAAQLPTEGIPAERVLAPREEVERAIAESRFRLGPVRLSPEISIGEATYDNNVYGTTEAPQGDFRATISAGFGLILPVTPNVFVRAGIFPAYTWYAELDERRFFGGRYGASALVFAGRLTLEGSAGTSREDVLFSSEAQARVIRNLGSARLGAEFRLLTRLFVYGEGQLQRFRFTGPGAEASVFDPTKTDRTDRSVRAELRYRWSKDVMVSAGYEETRSEFVASPEQYDNRTRAVLGSVYYDRRTLFLRVSGGYRELTPSGGSTVAPFSGLTGASFVSYTVVRPLDLQAFASRAPSYGLSSPYYISNRYGGGVVVRVGWRLKLQGFASAGTDDYSTPVLVPGGQLVGRKDDVRSYGGGLEFLFSPRIQLRFVGSEDRYDSSVSGNDRSFFRWLVSLNLGGNLLR